MTNDEAKSVLFDMLGKGIYVKDTKENQAILVALRALEQEPCEDWYDVPSDEMTLGQARQAVKDLRKMWAEHLEKEPCGKDINVPATDAISRQAVLEIVERVLNKGDALFEIEQLPSVKPQEPKTGWIPVSERLPEENKKVIVSDVFGVYIGRFIDAEENWGGEHFVNEHGMHSKSVTAWMPLPEPYKAESEDKE